MTIEPLDHPHLKRHFRRGLWLEYMTLAWNLAGAPVMMVTAFKARSAALAGFGVDSLIEIFASVVVIWQLKGVADNREQRALGLIGSAFFLLAAYVLAQSLWTLLTRSHPSASPIGMAWLVITVAAMALLAYGKLATGRALGNVVLRTEARVTLIDAGLAAAVLAGVGLNAAFGWWWADPVAGFVIVYYGVKEGRESLSHARA
ncbi:MAG TPA: cation transporter [Caulobacteraceae bacterium]|jgi:divalent metal cation (Fe/Co/Zn/Cd) transporter